MAALSAALCACSVDKKMSDVSDHTSGMREDLAAIDAKMEKTNEQLSNVEKRLHEMKETAESSGAQTGNLGKIVSEQGSRTERALRQAGELQRETQILAVDQTRARALEQIASAEEELEILSGCVEYIRSFERAWVLGPDGGSSDFAAQLEKTLQEDLLPLRLIADKGGWSQKSRAKKRLKALEQVVCAAAQAPESFAARLAQPGKAFSLCSISQ